MKRGKKLAIMLGLTAVLIFLIMCLNKNIETGMRGVEAPVGELTREERIEDFNYLYDTLKENFPYFEIEKRKTGFDWLAHRDEFIKQIENVKDDNEFFKVLNGIVKSIQNAHTGILSPDYALQYRELYKNYGAWRRTLENNIIDKRASYWSSIYNSAGYAYSVPVIFKYVEGKYIADNIKLYGKETDIQEGWQLIQINGYDPDEYVKGFINKRYLNYDYKRNKLKINNLIIYSNEIKKVKLKFKSLNGAILEKEYDLELININEFNNYRGMGLNSNIILEEIEKGSTGYIKIKSMNQETLSEDRERLKEFLNKIKDYPYLIIDIRENGGGSDNYWNMVVEILTPRDLTCNSIIAFMGGEYVKPFIKTKLGMTGIKLKPINVYKKSSIYNEDTMEILKNGFGNYDEFDKKVKCKGEESFKGKIFLLVDDYVYSSAESFAAFCRGSGFATIVGTYTGGDGIGVDPAVMVLPNSGLVVRFPFDMGINPDGTINEEVHTKPDIFVEQSVGDFIKDIKWREENSGKMFSPYDTMLNKTLELCR